jgi:beta-aspartyl-peptidase (threonine type)
MMPDEYFFTEMRWQQLQKAIGLEKKWNERNAAARKPGPEQKSGTVGAVALDQAGNLAAATSTGGMSNSRYGRIGDSPIIGAGTYANNSTCAISATGHGEFIIRSVLAYDLSALMEYHGLSLNEAAEKVIFGRFKELGGTGGLVAIDRHGNFALPFNTPGMYRGHFLQGQKPETAVYKP